MNDPALSHAKIARARLHAPNAREKREEKTSSENLV
jgi:hypothetical protein